MNITITRANNGRRHVYELRGDKASGKTEFMGIIAMIAGNEGIERITGQELASPFAYKRLEGKRILLIEELIPYQLAELKELVHQRNIKIAEKGKEAYYALNTIEYIFYVMRDE